MGFSPISGTSTVPYVIPIGFSTGQASLKAADSISLYGFLEQVGTVKDQNRQATSESQAVDSLINQNYFLDVANTLKFLEEKYEEINNFGAQLTDLTNTFNGQATAVNSAIDAYNPLKDALNQQISTMNAAINHINSLPVVTQADIETYNSAVNNYNNYLTSTGNPGLMAYADAANTYGSGVNTDNTVTVPQLNATITELDLGLPPVQPVGPGVIEVDAASLPQEALYSGQNIPTITPLPSADIPQVSLLQQSVTTTDLVNTYFLPFAKAFLAAIAATSKTLTSNDTFRAFINYVEKAGFKFDPSVVDSYIMNTKRPQLQEKQGAVTSSGGTLFGSMIVGRDTPNLEIILSTALFKLVSAQAQTPIPPHIYDQVNVFAVSLLAQLGASAGLSVIQTLGDKLKALGTPTNATDIALGAALLQNILKVVGDKGKSTLAALTALLKQVPGLTDKTASALAAKLVAAQNISLLLTGVTAVGVALKSPTLTKDILNTTFNPPPPTTTSSPPPPSSSSSLPSTSTLASTPNPSEAETIAQNNPLSVYNTDQITENPYSIGLSALVNNPPSSYAIQQTLNDRLEEDAKIPQPTASNIINGALTNTISLLLPNINSNENLFKETLANELLKTSQLAQQNLTPTQASTLAENAASLINNANQRPPALSPQALATKLTATIQNLTKGDVTNTLPDKVTSQLVQSLTDTNDPHSFASLYASQIRTLNIQNSQEYAQKLQDQRREFESPNIDSFVVFQKWMDPANNIINSYMTGVMYDKTIPSNWQKPLTIQV